MRGAEVPLSVRFRSVASDGCFPAGILAAAVLLLVPCSASAQEAAASSSEVSAHIGLSGELASPVGEFADFVDSGQGFRLFGSLNLLGEVLSLRSDLSMVQYGQSSRFVPLFPGTRAVGLEVETQNTITHFSVGPQLSAPLGGVRPFVRGSAGISYFATRSEARLGEEGDPLLTRTNFDDATLAWTAGGGVWIRLSGGETPLHLLVEGDYVRNGQVTYLREGDLQESREAEGEVEVDPVRSDGNLVSLRLGIAVGLR